MDIRDTAVRAAMSAGRMLAGHLGRAGRVEFKGAVDLVTEMDRRAESMIIDEIRSGFPEHGVLTEESAELKSGSGFKWIVDPLDGTTNYAHGLPFFCVSIAFEDSGTVRLGVVYNPMLDELFVAEKGKGASLNGAPIRVSATGSLDKGLLATGFPYDIRVSARNNLDNFSCFAKKAQAIRRAGSAALDLSYTAAGRFDGFWEMKLNPWDVAAGGLLVLEAGGMVTDFRGGAFSVYSDECLASNGLVHAQMIEVLEESAR